MKPVTWPHPGGPRTIRRAAALADRPFAMDRPPRRRERRARARIRRTYARLGIVRQA